jgi:recombination protein RecR
MSPIDKLTRLFERFPGIGPRQARRFVQYLLTASPSLRQELADQIKTLGRDTAQCNKCFRWFTKNLRQGSTLPLTVCDTCSDPHRDQSLLFVVEKDADIDNVEKSGYKGLYFVLGGTIPLGSDEPSKFVRERELLKRVQDDATPANLKPGGDASRLGEIILGLSATTEGDHTREILYERLKDFGKISSLGRGLSTGSELEYADPDTIAQALGNRH